MGARQAILKLVGVALPPRCPACGEVTDADHRFCIPCWMSLNWIGPPWCAACNIPFEYDRGPDACCAMCLSTPPVHDGVRAAVGYGAVARDVALKLKYGRRTALAATMAQAMARVMPEDVDLIVPVPLHRWRIWGRGFNQAALVAAQLSKLSDVPTDLQLLRRVKATPPLRGLDGRGRARAVRGAFAVAPEMRAALAGRHVVLADDVYTSGATTDACTRVLKRAGVGRVTVLCWARVIGPERVD